MDAVTTINFGLFLTRIRRCVIVFNFLIKLYRISFFELCSSYIDGILFIVCVCVYACGLVVNVRLRNTTCLTTMEETSVIIEVHNLIIVMRLNLSSRCSDRSVYHFITTSSLGIFTF